MHGKKLKYVNFELMTDCTTLNKWQVLVDQWKKLQHANLIALRQVFTTKTFNDHSMVFVYDFYPGAETLMSKHFNAPTQMSNAFMDPYG